MGGRSALSIVLALAGLASCAEQRVAGPPPSQSTAQPPLPGSPTPEATVVEAAPPPPPPVLEKTWQQAVRVERWADAAELFDALPEADRERPEMKYVRARMATALGDGERAVKLFTGLESDLPALSTDIARYRAEAQLIAG